jgi:hypothetical protein
VSDPALADKDTVVAAPVALDAGAGVSHALFEETV